jgi:RNA polymerase sigma-70 factor, ECF subfamily
MDEAHADPGEPSFRNVHQRYQEEIYTLLLGLVQHPEVAEDLTVETFMNAYRAWDRLPDGRDVGEWLREIAVNNARSWQGGDSAFGQPPRRPADMIERLMRAVAELPEEYRAVFLLDQQDLSYEEIAEGLGVSVPVVKTRLYRARARLKRKLEDG